MLLSDEQREQHRQIVKRAIALEPTLTLQKLKSRLSDKDGVELSIPYIKEIVAGVRKDWIEQYDHDTRDILAARFDELGMYLIENFRRIISEEKKLYDSKDGSVKAAIISQKNRILALKEIRETAKAMMEMKMDLGVIDRHLGKVKVDEDISKAHKLVASLIAYRKNNNGNEPGGVHAGTATQN